MIVRKDQATHYRKEISWPKPRREMPQRHRMPVMSPMMHGKKGRRAVQSSHIVSKSRSPRLSAPQTLHLFLESRLPNPKARPLPPGTSRLNRRPPSRSSSRSAAALSLAMRSASIASSSSSGVSGIVSREEMEGLRERIDVGVDGTDDEASGEE
jgi:hypothetical protein